MAGDELTAHYKAAQTGNREKFTVESQAKKFFVMGAIIRYVAVQVPDERCLVCFEKKIFCQFENKRLFIRDQ